MRNVERLMMRAEIAPATTNEAQRRIAKLHQDFAENKTSCRHCLMAVEYSLDRVEEDSPTSERLELAGVNG